MNDDLAARLSPLPPDLPTPGDRMDRVRARVVRRRRRVAAGVVGAGVLAGVVVMAVVPGLRSLVDPSPDPQPVSPGAALECPEVYGGDPVAGPGWVPNSPTAADVSGRLVPDAEPLGGVVCAYVAPGEWREGQAWSLTLASEVGSRATELHQRLADMEAYEYPAGLACSTVDMKQVNYLAGLNYPTGTVWVAGKTGGGYPCGGSGTTNGQFITETSMGWALDEALGGAEGNLTDPAQIVGLWDVDQVTGVSDLVPGVTLRLRADGSLTASSVAACGRWALVEWGAAAGPPWTADVVSPRRTSLEASFAPGSQPCGGSGGSPTLLAYALERSRSVTVDGDRLTLYDAHGAATAVLRKAPPPADVPRWTAREAWLIDGLAELGVAQPGAVEHGVLDSAFVGGGLDGRFVLVHSWAAGSETAAERLRTLDLGAFPADLLRIPGFDRVVSFDCDGIVVFVASYPDDRSYRDGDVKAAAELARRLHPALAC